MKKRLQIFPAKSMVLFRLASLTQSCFGNDAVLLDVLYSFQLRQNIILRPVLKPVRKEDKGTLSSNSWTSEHDRFQSHLFKILPTAC